MTDERPATGGLGAPREGAAADVLLSGRYRLGDQLGSGPAGHVYRAFDVLLQREVAVKVLDRIDGEVGVARAARAARMAARAAHDCLVEVLDVERGRPSFVTLELVQGQPLATLLESKPLARGHALALADEILGALMALHRAGAVHRDVSVDNVWLGQDGRAWLTSAGLTAAAHDYGLDLRLGAEPERRRAATPSTDVAAAGRLVATLLAPQVGDPIAVVVARATHEDPGRRYADAGDLCAALWQAVATSFRAEVAPAEIVEPDPRPQPAPPLPIGRIALAVAAATAAGLLIGRPLTTVLERDDERPEQPAPPQPVDIPVQPVDPPPPAGLPADELRRILDTVAASTVDLGPQSLELLARLRDLDRLTGIAREAEVADLYGEAAVDAGAGTNSSQLSTQITALLRPELTLDGLAALIDRDPVAAGPISRTFATRLRVLDMLQGDARRTEAFHLLLTSQTAAADGSLSPQLDATARAVLPEIVRD